MKKYLVITLVFALFFSGNIYAKERDLNKLTAGCIISIFGGLIAYSGFKMAEVSSPSMSIQSFTTITTGSNPYDITASGTLINSGNIPMKNITVTVEYKDYLGSAIATDTVSLSNTTALLAPGSTDTFSSSLTGLTTEPVYFSARYYADFDTEYKNSNVNAGITGTAIFAAGVFFICDYIFDWTDFFESQDMQVQLSSLSDGFNVIASKSF